MATPEPTPERVKIRVDQPFCVFRQTWRNMESLIFYGKIENAFKARYSGYVGFEPFDVEIMAFAYSMAEAAGLAKALKGETINPVLCHTNGVVYRNVKEAAKALGMHPSAIRNHLRGEMGFEKPKGFTFQKVPSELYLGD